MGAACSEGRRDDIPFDFDTLSVKQLFWCKKLSSDFPSPSGCGQLEPLERNCSLVV